MSFILPSYNPPGFNNPPLIGAPCVKFDRVRQPGVPPANYHATSIYPEYFQISRGEWSLLRESRMDCAVVKKEDGALHAVEFRHLKEGNLVVIGRQENGEQGIYVHARPFEFYKNASEKFSFRTNTTRETSFSIDYDELYDLLNFERQKGFIVWVLGPAVAFDSDARDAFAGLIESGYVHALLAGNALAVHDLEAALFTTALGQEIHSKKRAPLGHYNHLDAICSIKASGSIRKAIDEGHIPDGIMRAVILKELPYVLAGSIRDDGPLPEVIGNVYEAQDRMRALLRHATTVIAMATQLHSIASGNMVPSYKVESGNQVRPVYFYTVDMSEFAVNKLADRGSLTARSVLTNVQDFVVNVERGLRKRYGDTVRE